MLTVSRIREADEVLRELLAGAAGRSDPYPLYHRLRGLAPVYRSDLDGVWYVSDYASGREVLLDRRAGKTERGRAVRFGVNEELLRRTRKRQRPSMITANPPDHTRLRRAARGPFLPGRMEARLQSRIAEIVEERLDVVAGKGEADMMADVAFKLPVTVIGELVGVPPEDRDEFPPLVDEFFAAGQLGATPDQMDRADRAAERFRAYFADLIEAQRIGDRPNQDLVGSLVAAGNLDDDELSGTITLIFVAGFITTANLIGNGLLALLRNPGEMARLWADGALVPAAVEEMLRFDSPVQLVERTALEDFEVDGHLVPAGDTIVPLLGAANRDPGQFPEPDRFLITRPNAPAHISFAWGIHHCLGAPLARLEGQLVFSRLRERFARLELLDDDLAHRPSFGIRSLASLPIRFVAA
ncbi:MAG: cytochrome P450 [Acidimicrobiia bacterium]